MVTPTIRPVKFASCEPLSPLLLLPQPPCPPARVAARRSRLSRVLRRSYAAVPIIRLGSSVDWKAANRVSSVRNQKQCGSCWAFAAVAALESRYMIKKGIAASSASAPDLSEQQLVDCVRSPRTDVPGAA